MKKTELKEWLNVKDSVIVQMPNEIFDDLNNVEFNTYNHKCFAYAYYYLCSYIYRNALFGLNAEQYSQHNIIEVFTKSKTGISYVTKKNGVLDKMGYTKTTANYPVSCYMDNDILEFRMIKDVRKSLSESPLNHSPRLSVKEPIKGLIRFDGEDCTGTFYSYQKTHKIDINKFIDIVTDDKLGHVGLYIYGYISMMCDRYTNGFCISNAALGEIVGCSDRTIQNYTQRLETLELVKSERKLVDYKLLEKVYTT